MLERHKKLLNNFQHDLRLSPTPYVDMASSVGVSEEELLTDLRTLRKQGLISRIGAVFCPHKCGVSSLFAMSVPAEDLPRVAAIVSKFPGVNHNYEREHEFNLWFVAVAQSQAGLQKLIDEIELLAGLSALSLPMLDAYHIDLGFQIKWD